MPGGGVGFAQLVGDVNGDGQADVMLKFDPTMGQMPVVTDFVL